MSDKKRKPILHIIHERNHTHTQRVGSLASAHSSNSQIITHLDEYYPGIQYQNITPGIYTIYIDDDLYAVDVYDTLFGTDYLEVDGPTKAFLRVGIEKRYTPMYRLLDEHDKADSYDINDTINNWFDMLVVEGYSTFYSEYSSGEPALDNPMDVISLSELEFESTSNDGNSGNLSMNLKNFIKSLPDGTKDVCIVNAQQQKFHIINRIGRTTFSGYDAWSELEDWCDDIWCYYFCRNSDVAYQDSDNNIMCTRLPCCAYSEIKNTNKECIATCNDSGIGHGFIMKVRSELLGYTDDREDISHLYYFQKWLNEIFLSGYPMIVEYPLDSVDYKTILLSEYHVPTYFNNTSLKLTNIDECNVSYFYKTL